MCMNKAQLKNFVTRLRKPSILIGLVSQVISVLILVGVRVDQTAVMGVVTAITSILVTMGVLSNPDTKKKGFGDDIYPCSLTGELEQHVLVNGQLVCQKCGAVYDPSVTPPKKSSAKKSSAKKSSAKKSSAKKSSAKKASAKKSSAKKAATKSAAAPPIETPADPSADSSADPPVE